MKKIVLGSLAVAMLVGVPACQKNDASKVASPGQRAALTEYRQEISFTSPLASIKRGQVIRPTVTLFNAGKQAWPAAGKNPVHLSYHWMDKAQKMVLRDGVRTVLPRDLKGGESVDVRATINAPDKAGQYVLRMTMVQEGVAWFEDRGAVPLDLPVTVK